MTTKTTDLRKLDKTELIRALKTLPVEDWNKAYALAREESDYSWAATLSEANLYGANLYGANLNWATLDRANLYRANLNGANLYGANLDGKYAWIGEAAGYSVLMLGADNKAGHIIRAGCYTGTLDGVVERALEEDRSERTQVEAELVVVHGEGLLAEWNRKEKDNQ